MFLNYTRFDLGRRDTLDDFFDINQMVLIIRRRMEIRGTTITGGSRDGYQLPAETAMRFPELKLILGYVGRG